MVGQHPTIIRLLKGAYNQRPPKPKYSSTWEVTLITNFLASKGLNNSLSLKDLTLKLIMLPALTRPIRSNDLAHLDLKFLKFLPEGVQFQPCHLSKQSNPSRKVAPFIFPSFHADQHLCPVETLKTYITRTEFFRGTNEDPKTTLLLSYVKPHNPVTSSIIARWLLTVLSMAGIDTDTFKAHSVRGASATAAASAGLTFKQIMDCS